MQDRRFVVNNEQTWHVASSFRRFSNQRSGAILPVPADAAENRLPPTADCRRSACRRDPRQFAATKEAPVPLPFPCCSQRSRKPWAEYAEQFLALYLAHRFR